jgi:hypothetical protein
VTHRRSLALAAASLAGLPIAGLWVALTAATGKTYHLAPVLGAAAPAVAARLVARPTAHQAALLALAGLLTVAGAGRHSPPLAPSRPRPSSTASQAAYRPRSSSARSPAQALVSVRRVAAGREHVVICGRSLPGDP